MPKSSSTSSESSGVPQHSPIQRHRLRVTQRNEDFGCDCCTTITTLLFAKNCICTSLTPASSLSTTHDNSCLLSLQYLLCKEDEAESSNDAHLEDGSSDQRGCESIQQDVSEVVDDPRADVEGRHSVQLVRWETGEVSGQLSERRTSVSIDLHLRRPVYFAFEYSPHKRPRIQTTQIHSVGKTARAEPSSRARSASCRSQP